MNNKQIDTTTKFQAKFDLYSILKEAGVEEKDVMYIILAVRMFNEVGITDSDITQYIDTNK